MTDAQSGQPRRTAHTAQSTQSTQPPQLPTDPQSYWRESYEVENFPALEGDVTTDVVIVGGGITGLTSAYLLTQAGIKVVLIEAERLLNGTTGHTTAKITAQHGLIYDELIGNIGKSMTRLYYEANSEALYFIKKTIEEHNIDCELSTQDAYLYATTEGYAKKLEYELKAYESLGIAGELVDRIPFNLEVRNALVMKDQAQFHPLKYLAALIPFIRSHGGGIFENTTAVNIETDGTKTAVLTKEGHRVSGDYVLVCSHFPFYEGLGLYSTRMYADRSYAIVIKTKQTYPGGMYLSVDRPSRSLRSLNVNGEEMVLIVGEDHKTGQGIDTMSYYHSLATFAEQVFGVEQMAYRWSAQDLITLDKIPYIGALSANQPNVMIATGFRKWGITNGTAAALLFRDTVLGHRNHFKSLYTPSRFYVHPSLKNFLVENAGVVGHLIKGKLDLPHKDPESLANDEGAVITLDGHRKGAYRDKEGELHIVDTTCTHVGCEVNWNSAERTWDCPCHGSRFSYTGEVINGPAEKPLQKYDYKMTDNLTSDDSGY